MSSSYILFWANSSACVQGLKTRRLRIRVQVCLTLTSKLFSCVAHSYLIVPPNLPLQQHLGESRKIKKKKKSEKDPYSLKSVSESASSASPLSQNCSMCRERERQSKRQNQKGIKDPPPKKALAEICMGIFVRLYLVSHFCHIFIHSTNT